MIIMKFRDVILEPFRKAPRNKRPARSIFLLDATWDPLLESILSMAREAVGGPLSDALEMFPSEDELGDVRIQRGLFELVFGYFFPIRSPVGDSRQLLERRKRLFEWLQAKGLLFARSTERSRILRSFLQEELHVDPLQLDEKDLELLFFADHDEFLQVEDSGVSVSPELLRSKYNWEATRALMRNSIRLVVKLRASPLGSTVRKLYFMAKKYGLNVEFNQEHDGHVSIHASGPVQLVGRAIKYGNALASFMWILMKETVRSSVPLNEIWVEAVVNNQKRWVHVDVALLFDSISHLTDNMSEILSEQDVGYDSSVEEAFYVQFQRCDAFSRLEHDAPVIINNNRVIIPDGIFRYRNELVYLEIMGFWTDEYARRKAKQLNELPEHLKDRYLILVDEQLSLNGLSIPFLTFSGKQFPWQSIREFLWEKMEKHLFNQHLKSLLDRKEEICKDVVAEVEKHGGACDAHDLSSLVAAETDNEAMQLIKELWTHSENCQRILGLQSHTRGLLVYLKSFVASLQEELSTKLFSHSDYVPLTVVTDFLRTKGLDDRLIPLIMELLPLEKKYASLTEVVVKLKNSRSRQKRTIENEVRTSTS